MQDTSLFFNAFSDYQKKEIDKKVQKYFLQENTTFETEMKKPAEDKSSASENGQVKVRVPVYLAGAGLR